MSKHQSIEEVKESAKVLTLARIAEAKAQAIETGQRFGNIVNPGAPEAEVVAEPVAKAPEAKKPKAAKSVKKSK